MFKKADERLGKEEVDELRARMEEEKQRDPKGIASEVRTGEDSSRRSSDSRETSGSEPEGARVTRTRPTCPEFISDLLGRICG